MRSHLLLSLVEAVFLPLMAANLEASHHNVYAALSSHVFGVWTPVGLIVAHSEPVRATLKLYWEKLVSPT